MPGRGLHVDRDDRAFPHVGQCLHRQVVDQRTVDEQLAAANLRGRDDRQVDAEPDRLPQRSVPGNLQPSAAEIDAGTQVAARQLLDQARAEDAVQHGLEAFAADQRVAGDGEVAQRPAAHPFVVADRVDLIGVVARGEQRADHGAHADPGDTVDPEAGGGQFLEHVDVRERPCATAGSTIPTEEPASRRAMRETSEPNSVSRIRCEATGSSAAAQPVSAPGAGSYATSSQACSSG
jgi:hypothetical protein